jgi:pullulanase
MEATIDFSGNPLDAVVMEINVRDFSMDPEVPFCHRGKFLGLVETGLKTPGGNPAGFDYLKQLGITHVQLMPVLDFAGVDELDPDRTYNWGYNPIQYFVPEGWYATDPMDPYSRINEFREMVDAFHQANIGVILDVVFNHVYDLATFPLELLAPGYAFRVDREGIHTALSGCKNDLATERKMVRKLILDAVLYWATEFKIDGFRFDLMGLIDFETMNEIRQELEAVNPKILVYGEGWKMQTGNESDRMAHLQNKKVLHTLGFFNDRFRDQVKGNTFILAEKGYATGDLTMAEDVAEWMLGGARHRLLFKYTSQSVNYVECHDNLTLYAKILQIHPDEILAKKQSLLATAMTLLSLGMPFLHLGQEFFRTKGFVENTFKAGDDINRIVWKDTDASQAAIRLVAQLIQIRRHHVGFRLKSHSDLMDHATAIVLPSKTILITLRADTELTLCFKPTATPEEITLPKGAELLVASSDDLIKNHSGTWRLSDIGTCLFQRKDKPI